MKRKLIRENGFTNGSGVLYFERGLVTRRFERLAEELLERRSKLYAELAK